MRQDEIDYYNQIDRESAGHDEIQKIADLLDESCYLEDGVDISEDEKYRKRWAEAERIFLKEQKYD